MQITNKTILITGGTGSFGKKFTETIISNYKSCKIIVYSRDELKQFEMREIFPTNKFPIKYIIGDVRDRDRLRRVLSGVDIVVHAAALKQVPTAEFNPFEVINTNIYGAQNIIEGAIDNNVKRVLAMSTDKACCPINLYGATKLASDKLFSAANHSQNNSNTLFSVVRYGNVLGSRGSVAPFFVKKKKEGILPITDINMTRFLITLQKGANFVIECIKNMKGGELFVPKIPSIKITDLAKAISPNAKLKIIGIRPGEKIHEVMIATDDSINTLEFDKYFVIQPAHPWWDNIKYIKLSGGKKVKKDFKYSSDINKHWLSKMELKQLLKSNNII